MAGAVSPVTRLLGVHPPFSHSSNPPSHKDLNTFLIVLSYATELKSPISVARGGPWRVAVALLSPLGRMTPYRCDHPEPSIRGDPRRHAMRIPLPAQEIPLFTAIPYYKRGTVFPLDSDIGHNHGV